MSLNKLKEKLKKKIVTEVLGVEDNGSSA